MTIDTCAVAVVLMTAALGGCGPRYALDRVPIEGGSHEQRASVRDALSRFEAWVGPGRVRLSGIAFHEVENGSAEYNRPHARIRLEPDLSPGLVELNMRHELCHALDFQEGLLDRPVDALETLTDAIDAGQPLRDIIDDLAGRELRTEVFATLCQQAPLGTAFLEHPCPGEARDASKAARWIREHVWSGEPDVVEGAIEARALADWDAGVDAESLNALGSLGEAKAAFGLVGEDAQASALLSLVDGTEVEQFWDVDTTTQPPLPVPLPHRAPELEPWAPVLTVTGAQAMVLGEQAIAIVQGVQATGLGGRFAPQLLALDNGQWSVVQGACPTEVSAVFVAAGEPYVAWYEDQDVTWAAIDGLSR